MPERKIGKKKSKIGSSLVVSSGGCNGDIKVRDEQPQTPEEVHYKCIF